MPDKNIPIWFLIGLPTYMVGTVVGGFLYPLSLVATVPVFFGAFAIAGAIAEANVVAFLKADEATVAALYLKATTPPSLPSPVHGADRPLPAGGGS